MVTNIYMRIISRVETIVSVLDVIYPFFVLFILIDSETNVSVLDGYFAGL